MPWILNTIESILCEKIDEAQWKPFLETFLKQEDQCIYVVECIWFIIERIKHDTNLYQSSIIQIKKLLEAF